MLFFFLLLASVWLFQLILRNFEKNLDFAQIFFMKLYIRGFIFDFLRFHYMVFVFIFFRITNC